MTSSLRVVFMGTPGFSVGIMQAMHAHDVSIVGVVTVADKPAGRGQVMHQSAVKQYALTKNIPVLQPLKLKDPEFLAALEALNADVFVVVAFRMLPTEVWKMPKKGTFNLHASLLPDYRGAAPINWTVINGDKVTGVSTFFIDDQIDTGNVIRQEKIEIHENETAGNLHDRMMIVGGKLVVKTLAAISNDAVTTIPQANLDGPMRPAPKLTKENTRIDWNSDAKTIHSFILGLSPYPGAWTIWENKKGEQKIVKIYLSELSSENIAPKTLSNTKKQLFVGTKNGSLQIESFQVEGKKRLSAAEWLVGNSTSDWTIV